MAGVAEYSNARGGQWRGSNGQWYKIDPATGKSRPFYGNQYTGSRNQVLERAGAYKALGRTLFVASAAMSLADAFDAYQSGNPVGVGKAALDATMAGVATFGGPVGLGIGTTYFIVDAFGGIPLGR